MQDLSFSPNGKFIVTLGGQDDNMLLLWSVSSGRCLCGTPAANDSSSFVQYFNNDNDRLVLFLFFFPFFLFSFLFSFVRVKIEIFFIFLPCLSNSHQRLTVLSFSLFFSLFLLSLSPILSLFLLSLSLPIRNLPPPKKNSLSVNKKL